MLDGFSLACPLVVDAMLDVFFGSPLAFANLISTLCWTAFLLLLHFHMYLCYASREFQRMDRLHVPPVGFIYWQIDKTRKQRTHCRNCSRDVRATVGICKSDRRPKFLTSRCSETRSALKAIHPIQACFLTSSYDYYWNLTTPVTTIFPTGACIFNVKSLRN